jgi:cellulose synthase/poly-beta-1,6-N-acetylglucosamine synthase-like glycosyltransferase
MEYLFFILLFLAVYPYFFYPLLVSAWSMLAGKPWEQRAFLPGVSLIISVYNEEKVIAEKLKNALALDYPPDLLEIIVVSDGSTDNTNSIVSSFQDPRIVLKDYQGRSGKTACLNRAVPEARGDIVIFTDANSMFPPDTVNRIATNFCDGRIGLVTGWTKYRKPGGGEETSGLYSRLERATKSAESLVSSCVGADGAVFAIRRVLYRPLQDYDINDFVIPLNTIGQGKRVVLDPGVYCIEDPSENERKEFRRQVRITNRTLGAIWRNARFLNPLTYGSFSFFLLSHKIIRFLVPFFFLGTFTAAVLLAERSFLFAGFAALQLSFICIGLARAYRNFGGKIAQLCSFFLLTIAAQFIGWMKWAMGKSDVMWKPER